MAVPVINDLPLGGVTPSAEEKGEIQLYEHQGGAVENQIEDLKAGKHVQLKSQLDRMSTMEAVRVFKWAILICVGAAVSAATDGEII